MKKFLSCVFLAGIFSTISIYSSELPVYNTEKTGITPIIDGNINDQCWEKVQWQTDFSPLTGNPALRQKTRFKVLYDNERFYFAVECFEDNINKLKTTAKEKDGPVYLDDSIEIFLVPDKDIPDDANWRMFYHFILNAAGIRYDETSLALANNKAWNCQWKAVTKVNKTSWTAEVEIPFFVFNITDKTGSTWRFNITRNRKAVSTELSSWSPLKHSFGEALNFGYLKNIDVDFSDYLLSLSKPDVTSVLKGEKVSTGIKLDMLNRSPKKLKCEIEVQLLGKDETPYIAKHKVDIQQNNKKTETLDFPDIPQGVYSCTVAVCVKSKTVKLKEHQALDINPVPLRIKLITPSYRNNIYPGQKINNILFNASIVSSPEKLKDYRILFNLKKGKEILQTKETNSPAAESQFSFDAASLSPGKYVIETVMYDKGKEILRLNQPLKKLALTKGNEVWIDKDLNLVVNGKKTFIHGFLASVNPELAKQIKGKGFNLVHTYAAQYKNDIQTVEEILKPSMNADAKVMFYPYYKTVFGFFGWGKKTDPKPYLSDTQFSGMIDRVKKFAPHSSILAWYLCDEPRGVEFRRNLKKVYEALKETDPYHPVVALDCSPAEAATLAGSCDVILCDFYPDFNKKNGVITPLCMIYNGIMEVRKATGDKLPIWFVPQAFDRSDYYENPEKKPFRAPNYIESRCMNYLALTAGAKALIYFQFNGKPGILAHPEMKLGIIEGLGSEISDLTPVLLEKTINGASVSKPEIKIMLKKHKGKFFLIAVNPSQKGVNNVTIKINVMSSKKISVLFESRQLKVANNIFSDSFEPFAAHVYTNDMDFPQTFELAKIIKKINKLKKKD